MNLKSFFLNHYNKARVSFFVIADFLLLNLTLFILKEIFTYRWSWQWELIPLGVILLFFLLGLYKTPWRFFGFRDLYKIFLSLLTISLLIFPFLGFEFSIIFLGLSFLLISLFRGSKRFYREILKQIKEKDGIPTLIIGAGNTGEYLVRELLRGRSKYKPIAFVDEDKTKIGTKIQGIPVKGNFEDIPNIVKKFNIKASIIAIPSLNHAKIRRIFDLLHKSGVKEIKIIPSVNKLPKTPLNIKDLKDLSIEDLLFREPVKIDQEKVKKFIQGKVIFVSGAGGSIGSEIVRQLIQFEPKKVIAFDIDETELYNLYLELKELFEKKEIELTVIVGDIRDYPKLVAILQKEKPNIVFHAAAYKHVPMMELYPEEAVKTNVLGTYNIAKASIEANIEKFINISTDKAVNPTSVMGATKRVAEIICKAFNTLGKTKFISVRFGNVLGSRGSVIPIFLEQLKKGGPLTVTHPEMQRYFMTIPEAVLLVFQAAAMGKGGEVFVLDMGKPIKIVKLAEQLIKLQGLEPYKDIDIVFTGPRPGEKLFEELLTAEEGTDKTYHERIYVAKSPIEYSLSEVEQIIQELLEKAQKLDREGIKELLRKYIPFYKGDLALKN